MIRLWPLTWIAESWIEELRISGAAVEAAGSDALAERRGGWRWRRQPAMTAVDSFVVRTVAR